ncbi:MAG: hypothetical protein LBK82_08985 [Planctomycetaceae bacterium]|jgi:hypothetical protein|nr:hypothetical protein [Planctomycetaceae bacterium]
MKGLLDDIFSGPKGVASTLLQELAGAAELVWVGTQGNYDPENDRYEATANESVQISFAVETVNRNVLTHVDGVQILAGDLVGLTSADMVTRPIREKVDKLILSETTYLIISTEMIKSGNKTAMIRILARKVK